MVCREPERRPVWLEQDEGRGEWKEMRTERWKGLVMQSPSGLIGRKTRGCPSPLLAFNGPTPALSTIPFC